MDWSRISSWPNGFASRRVKGPVHWWHVQEMGSGPTVLLLHGAGASTHSWRDILPPLADTHHVVAIDLPGHGFTELGARQRSGLEHMASDIAGLCAFENWHPAAIVGHSAGAAIALRMSLSPRGHAPQIIAINAALESFGGLAGLLFPPLAKVLAATPFVPSLFSSVASDPRRIEALISSTGSQLPPQSIALYRQLVADRKHVNGALLMMAQWSLTGFLTSLEAHPAKVTLVVGDKDETVEPRVSETAASLIPEAQMIRMSDAGHLLHEEHPKRIVSLVRDQISPRT